MALQSNIERRGAVYYVRIGLPADLIRARALAGLTRQLEVKKSLGTRDPKEAKRIAPKMLDRLQAEFDRELADLGNGKTSTRVRKLLKPSAIEIESAVWGRVQSDLSNDEAERLRHPTSERRDELIERVRAKAETMELPVDPRQRQIALIAATLDEVIELDRTNIRTDKHNAEREAIAADNKGKREAFEHIAEEMIDEQGWDILPGSPDFTKLCNLLRSARTRALTAFQARDEGDLFSDVANPPTPTHIAEARTLAATKRTPVGASLLTLLAQYLVEQGSALSSESIVTKKTATTLFSQFLGDHRAVATITRPDFVEFKRMLADWPRTANNQRQFKGKSFVEIVKLNREKKTTTIAGKTVNNYLTALGAFFSWLEANGHYPEQNITRGLLLRINKKATRRKPYTADELSGIFSLPVFTGTDSLNNAAKPGAKRVNDWRFWIPAICLYTGARLGEIAQLRTEDVKQVGEHWVFQITDEGADMNVKNPGSSRFVPIHPELVKLGLLKYHKRATASGSVQLFPELRTNEHGRFAGDVSKWWRKYLLRFGIVGNAYRLRHSFTDAMRRAGYMNEAIGSLLGHQDGSTTEGYGEEAMVTVDHRARMVAAAKFPIKLTPPK